MPAIFDLESALNVNLLAYAVGRQMECCVCARLLDSRNAVLATYKSENGEQTVCGCGACIDDMTERIIRNCANQGVIVDVDAIDGRLLHHPVLEGL